MKPITLEGFDAVFAGDPDPWGTFRLRDEAVKRREILRALGPGRRGRVLELAAGNGSNSVDLAACALRLDATEGTDAGLALVERALNDRPRARAVKLALPERFPRPHYDAIVIAELLYYLSARDMAATARETRRRLRIGGRLVLAHHHVDFHDFAQHACGLHDRFLRAAAPAWRARGARRTRLWTVQAWDRIMV